MSILRTDVTHMWGLILLLLWTPLAFGSVHAWATGLMALHIFLLVTAWMIHCQLTQASTTFLPVSPRSLRQPWVVFLGLFITILIIQQIPWPPAILQRLSPAIYDVYRQFLPNWSDASLTLSLHATATRTGFITFLAYTTLFVYIVRTATTYRRVRLVFGAIVCTAFLIALLGISQQLSGTSSIYWRRETHYSAFFGPYVNRNHGAAYLATALVIGLGLLFTQIADTNRHKVAPTGGKISHVTQLLMGQQVLLVYSLAVIAGALCLALSRGAILSLGAGLTLLALLLHKRHGTSERRWGWGVALSMMAAMMLWLGSLPLLNRLITLVTGEETFSLTSRLDLWRATWKIASQFPLWGIGYDAFPVVLPRYQPETLRGHEILQAHNDLLQLLAETGWAGCLFFIGSLLFLVTDIVKRWRINPNPFVQVMVPSGLAALSVMGLHSLVDFNFHIPANALLFTAILALTYAGTRLPHSNQMTPLSKGTRTRGRLNRRSVVLPLLGLAVMLWLSYKTVRVVIADRFYPQHKVLRLSHWVHQASDDVRQQRLQLALGWMPQQDRYWLSLARIQVKRARQASRAQNTDNRQSVASQLRQATGLYQRALQLRPTDAHAQVHLLSVQRDLLTLSRATAPREKALATSSTRLATLAPANPYIQYALGANLLAHEMTRAKQSAPTEPLPPASRQFFQRAIRLDTTYIKHTLRIHLAHLPQMEALHRFALTIPAVAEAHVIAARLLEERVWPQARLHYLTALTLAPSEPSVMHAYANALHQRGAYAAAREVWEQLNSAAPDDTTAYLRLAEVCRQLGDNAAWVHTLHRLVTRFPTQVQHRHQLAKAYLHLGHTAAAEAAWKRVTELSPHSPEGYLGLARTYEHQQNNPQAIAIMRKVVNMAPGTLHAHRYLAHLYQKIGAMNMALHEYERLATFHPDNPDVLYQLGQSLQLAGNPHRAREYYHRAVQLNPDHTGFRRALVKLEEQLSNDTGSTHP